MSRLTNQAKKNNMFARSLSEISVPQATFIIEPPDLTATSPIDTPSINDLFNNIPSNQPISTTPKKINETCLGSDFIKPYLNKKRTRKTKLFVVPKITSEKAPLSFNPQFVPASTQNAITSKYRRAREEQEEKERKELLLGAQYNLKLPVYDNVNSLDVFDMVSFATLPLSSCFEGFLED